MKNNENLRNHNWLSSCICTVCPSSVCWLEKTTLSKG